MIDISAVGSVLAINFADGETLTISEFSDEGTPFDAPDVDVSTNAKNLNGTMISSRTPSVYPVSVTVIPRSTGDIELTNRLQKSALMGNGSTINSIYSITVKSLILKVPCIDASGTNVSDYFEYQWSNGRMKSGPTGPSTSADGRMSSRTFTFEFEKFDPPSGTPMFNI